MEARLSFPLYRKTHGSILHSEWCDSEHPVLCHLEKASLPSHTRLPKGSPNPSMQHPSCSMWGSPSTHHGRHSFQKSLSTWERGFNSANSDCPLSPSKWPCPSCQVPKLAWPQPICLQCVELGAPWGVQLGSTVRPRAAAFLSPGASVPRGAPETRFHHKKQ